MRGISWLAAVPFICGGARAGEVEAMLCVRDVPAHGVALVDVNPRAVAGTRATARAAAGASATVEGRPVPVQVIPALDAPAGDGDVPVSLAVRLPRGGDHVVKLALGGPAAGAPAAPAGPVRTPWIAVTHDPGAMGGLPSRIEFVRTGKVFGTFGWQDRLHHRALGSFHLRHDPAPAVELVSDGPVCAVVRVRARYGRGGERPASEPEAVYDWVYFRDIPLVFVRALVRQREGFAWDEIHFLELNFPDESFRRWAGAAAPDAEAEQGSFTASARSFGFAGWGALVDGKSAIAVVRGGQALFHDGRGGYGTYLHAHGDAAWRGLRDPDRRASAWLWVGSDDEPAGAVAAAAGALPSRARAVLTTPAIRARIDAERAAAASRSTAEARRRLWRAAMAERLEAEGRLPEIPAWLDGKAPASWTTFASGDLAMVLERTAGGLLCRSLFDLATAREIMSDRAPPLFAMTLRRAAGGREVRLDAASGWEDVRVEAGPARLDVRWSRATDPALRGLSVAASAAADPARHAVEWTLGVENESPDWSVWRVAFPQLAVGPFGDDVAVLFPRGPGEVKRGLRGRAFRYAGTYPDGWTSMQFLAAYAEEAGTGLYAGLHDPEAHTKDILVEGRPDEGDVLFAFDHPAPDMGRAGSAFALSGRAVLRILRGDWFDAAQVYRAWVRDEARWFPELGPDGRADTPMWMRELPVWAQGGGTRGECAGAVKEFARAMGTPAGFHWYNWHRIPFDNDYPHYFPAKDGFAEGVRELQEAGVHVMPYINGRLWDTRDRGTEDHEFTRVALAAATKDEKGAPLTESYGSKEADGSPVVLAAMCPSTELWQRRVRDTVLRLMNDCGTSAVYIDQVAAAAPKLCFDPAHGHPLGGGNWWWRGYGRMLEDLREAMPRGRAITTECNAEPYLRWFDGYLTWHWQFDGQVPAFPAVYGGAVQMFGRAYRGGPTRDLALRMKAGQQLVFGEQIGWIDPGVAAEKENSAFLRDVVRLRWELRRFFHAGEMARPLRLSGEMPKVKADWQWSGTWPVSTDAVLTGAWRLPKEKRLVLLFVNVSDRAVTAALGFSPAEYGLEARGGGYRVTTVTAAGRGESREARGEVARQVTFEPRKAWAWEIAGR